MTRICIRTQIDARRACECVTVCCSVLQCVAVRGKWRSGDDAHDVHEGVHRSAKEREWRIMMMSANDECECKRMSANEQVQMNIYIHLKKWRKKNEQVQMYIFIVYVYTSANEWMQMNERKWMSANEHKWRMMSANDECKWRNANEGVYMMPRKVCKWMSTNEQVQMKEWNE